MWIALALTILTPVQSAPEASAPPWWGTFPIPRSGLVLGSEEPGNPSTLMEVVETYCELTGQHLIVGREIRNLLENATVGLCAPMVFPPDEVQPVVEALLVESHFVLQVLRAEAPRLLAIHSTVVGSGPIEYSSRHVTREELPKLADHPAIVVTTSVILPHVDVSDVASSLSALSQTSGPQAMWPVAGTDTMVLAGRGPGLLNLVDLLERLDQVAKANQGQGMGVRRHAEAQQQQASDQ